MKKIALILAILLAFSMVGCVAQMPTEPPEPTEQHSHDSTTAETTARQEDVLLDAEEVKLSDFEGVNMDCYLLISTQETVGFLYRIYMTPNKVWIEYYETEPITADFLNGGAVAVKLAYTNIISRYDYYIFGNRFYLLGERGQHITTDELADQWEIGSAAIVFMQDYEYQCVSVDAALAMKGMADDEGLFMLMDLLYMDRGLDIQHFGPTQGE